jgi:hypothetical protein
MEYLKTLSELPNSLMSSRRVPNLSLKKKYMNKKTMSDHHPLHVLSNGNVVMSNGNILNGRAVQSHSEVSNSNSKPVSGTPDGKVKLSNGNTIVVNTQKVPALPVEVKDKHIMMSNGSIVSPQVAKLIPQEHPNKVNTAPVANEGFKIKEKASPPMMKPPHPGITRPQTQHPMARHPAPQHSPLIRPAHPIEGYGRERYGLNPAIPSPIPEGFGRERYSHMKKEGCCGSEGFSRHPMRKEGYCGEGFSRHPMRKEGYCGEGFSRHPKKEFLDPPNCPPPKFWEFMRPVKEGFSNSALSVEDNCPIAPPSKPLRYCRPSPFHSTSGERYFYVGEAYGAPVAE